MKKLGLLVGLWFLVCGAAHAGSVAYDVCYSHVASDINGKHFAGVAPIYPRWTIERSEAPIPCESITAQPVGTVVIQGDMIEGDAYTDPDEIAVVSFLFRPYGAATIYAVGVARLGDTYPMTMLSGKSATVRNLYQGSVDVFRFMP